MLAVYGHGRPGLFGSKDAHLLPQASIPTANLPRLPLWAHRLFVLSATLAIVAALTWALLLFGTRLAGYEAGKANGTSMEPALHHGDALVLGGVDTDSLKVGDVVWAVHEGWPIMHRVVDIYTDAAGQRIVVTKGDNLEEADPPVRADEVQGRLVMKVPALGASARLLGLEDGYRLLILLVQGFAATSIVFGLVYLQDMRRAGRPVRATSEQGLIEP